MSELACCSPARACAPSLVPFSRLASRHRTPNLIPTNIVQVLHVKPDTEVQGSGLRSSVVHAPPCPHEQYAGHALAHAACLIHVMRSPSPPVPPNGRASAPVCGPAFASRSVVACCLLPVLPLSGPVSTQMPKCQAWQIPLPPTAESPGFPHARRPPACLTYGHGVRWPGGERQGTRVGGACHPSHHMQLRDVGGSAPLSCPGARGQAVGSPITRGGLRASSFGGRLLKVLPICPQGSKFCSGRIPP
jgi:hypothetical protein